MWGLLRTTVTFLAVLIVTAAHANICQNVQDLEFRDDTIADVDFYQLAFSVGAPATRGNRDWNSIIVECNRRRDNNGGEIRKIMNRPGYEYARFKLLERNLPAYLVKGRYEYFGNPITKQNYRYVLRRENGVWHMTIPYEAEINDVVENRVDFYMGRARSDGSRQSDVANAIAYYADLASNGASSRVNPANVEDLPPAWKLFANDQTMFAGGTTRLIAAPQPIAFTHCASQTFFPGMHDRYDGEYDADSGSRDRTNRHIDLGRIQNR